MVGKSLISLSLMGGSTCCFRDTIDLTSLVERRGKLADFTVTVMYGDSYCQYSFGTAYFLIAVGIRNLRNSYLKIILSDYSHTSSVSWNIYSYQSKPFCVYKLDPVLYCPYVEIFGRSNRVNDIWRGTVSRHLYDIFYMIYEIPLPLWEDHI